LKHNS